MKRKHLLLLLLMAIFAPWVANAQSLSDYTFSTDVTTFNSIVSTGTQMSFSSADDGYATCTFPFAFNYGESTFASGTSIACSANGFMYLNETSTSGTTGSYSGTSYRVVNAFLQQDGHIGRYTGDDPSGAWYKYDETTGTFTIEYHKLGTYSSPYGSYTYQVVFHSNGDIDFIYGEIDHGTATSRTLATYLTDGPKSDFVFVTGDWASPTISSSYATRPFSPAPEEGLRYTFTRPVISCYKPQNLAATLTPGNGSIATLGWTPNTNGSEDTWVLEYGTADDFTGATSVSVTGTPSKDLTGLTPETKYYARVKADCGSGNTSEWSNTCAFTPTNAYNLTVNDGTSTSSTIPIYYYYVSNSNLYTGSQFIIPAAALTNIQWASIEKLTFYANTATVNYGDATFTVYVGETTNTTQTSYTDWNTLTAVYSGTVSVSNNVMEITFDTPFAYTNSNLLIGFKQTAVGTSPSSFYWYGVSGSTTGVSVYTGYSSSPTQSSFSPKVTLNYTPGEAPSCLPPTNLDAEPNAQSATLSWSSDAAGFSVAHSTNATANPDNCIVGTVTTNSFAMNELTVNTDHYFWVRANCNATEQSTWTGPASVYIGYCTPAPTSVDGSGISNVAFGTGTYTVNNNTTMGNGVTYLDCTNKIGAVEASIASTVAITYKTGYTYGTVIWVDLNNNLAFESNEILYYGQSTSANPTTLEATITIPATQSTGDYRMRIGGADSAFDTQASADPCYSNSYACFQDYTLRVLPVPTCFQPQNLQVGNTTLTAHEATLTWEPNALGTETAWVLQVATNNTFTQGLLEYNVSETPSKALTNLTPETTYYARVKPDCDGEGNYWSELLTFTTLPTCPAPTNLHLVSNTLTAHEAVVEWTESGEATTWIVEFATNAEFNDYLIETVEDEPTLSFHGLTGETTYYVRVYAQCGDYDESQYSNVINFTTEVACPAPNNLTVNDITGHEATLAWNGTCDSYIVSYRTAAGIDPVFSEGFENGIGNWTLNNCNSSSTVNTAANFCHSGDAAFVFVYNSNPPQYLISPLLTGISQGMYLDFYYKNTSTSWPETFQIGFSSTDNEIASFTFGEVITASDAQWHRYHETIPAGTKYICWKLTSNNMLRLCIDDIAVGIPVEAGEWQISTTAETSFEFTDLLALRKYEVKVQGDCGVNDGLSQEVLTTFTTDVACPAPTNLAYSDLKSNQVDLTWTSYASAWQVFVNDTPTEIPTQSVTINGNTMSFTLTGLVPETDYVVKIKANCTAAHDGYSDYSNSVSFTTLASCPQPTEVTVTDIGHYTATVSWTGDSEYTLRLGVDAEPTVIQAFGFEDGVIPTNFTNTSAYPWEVIDDDASEGTHSMRNTNQGVASSTSTISVTANYTAAGYITFDAKCMGEGTTSIFDKCIFSIDGTAQFTKGANGTIWDSYNFDVAAGEHTFTWSYTKDSSVNPTGDSFTVDNIVMGLTSYAWQPDIEDITETTYTLTELNAGTKYYVQVQANCGDNPVSDIVSFTTVSPNDKYFITAGNWGTDTNWEPTGVPTLEQKVELRANATIESGYVAEANSISIGDYTLTIEDGGQLIHDNVSSFVATVKKNIVGYGEANYGTNNGYVLLASPCAKTINMDNSDGTNIRTGTYDFYNWSPTTELEWINWGSSYAGSPVALNRGTGYLYANQEGTELTFNGYIYGSASSFSKYVRYTAPGEGTEFSDWYLIGNPFVCNAYLVDADENGAALAYYKMNDDGNGFEAVANAASIAPMEGVFYQIPANASSSYVYFTRTAPASKISKLNMNLRSNDKQLDNAILVFGGNQQLGKMSFRENSSKIYMPVEGKDYAIATAESSMGEMPVSFKAENNGTYTLSFTAEEVSFAYLHLIDNMTGIETDLLETPSYSFEAKTTDYASRFKLVFATGNNGNDDNFAFFSNGNFVINNEGNATLQVVDVMGRILKSESINGCANVNVNAAPGVYMLRLVNGDNVKVQKVVVR